MSSIFDPSCRRCPRLAAFLDFVRERQPSYYCRPVAPFGDRKARLLIVGLAPGMHGANRTGRPFTGDHAGILLYATLFKFGLASAPVSSAADDALELQGARITNSVKCLPPENKPTAARDQGVQRLSARGARAKPGRARYPGARRHRACGGAARLELSGRASFDLRTAPSTP